MDFLENIELPEVTTIVEFDSKSLVLLGVVVVLALTLGTLAMVAIKRHA